MEDLEVQIINLGVNLDECKNWESSLKSIIPHLENSFKNQNYDVLLIFFIQNIPKILNLTNVKGQSINILKTEFVKIIKIIFDLFFITKNFNLISILNNIYDSNQNLYNFSERNESDIYSPLLTEFIQYFQNKYLFSLLKIFENSSYFLDDTILIFQLIDSIYNIHFRSIFNNQENEIQIIFEKILDDYFNQNDSNISKKIIILIGLMIKFISNTLLENFLRVKIYDLLFKDKIDLKYIGMSIFSLVYENYSEDNENLLYLIEILIPHIDTIESLNLLKKTFIHFAEKKILTEKILIDLWENMISKHISILPKILEILSEILLKTNLISVVKTLISKPPLIDILKKLIHNENYFNECTNILFFELIKKSIEVNKSFEILINISSRKNLLLKYEDLELYIKENNSDLNNTLKLILEIQKQNNNFIKNFNNFINLIIPKILLINSKKELISIFILIINNSPIFFSNDILLLIFNHLIHENDKILFLINLFNFNDLIKITENGINYLINIFSELNDFIDLLANLWENLDKFTFLNSNIKLILQKFLYSNLWEKLLNSKY